MPDTVKHLSHNHVLFSSIIYYLSSLRYDILSLISDVTGDRFHVTSDGS